MHAAASGFEFGRSRIEALVDAKEDGWWGGVMHDSMYMLTTPPSNSFAHSRAALSAARLTFACAYPSEK